MQRMQRITKCVVNYFSRRLGLLSQKKVQRELDGLYRLLYHLVHDPENSPDMSTLQTQAAFAKQWQKLNEGNYLLTDPWFKENVARVLCEQEILLRPEWFPGKEVLDAGCGSGRWSYGLAKLGAHLTSVDVNPVAIQETQKALAEFSSPKSFVVTPLEQLTKALPQGATFHLVFCWGVAHHCKSFNQVLRELVQLTKDGGLLYLYLYGRESLPFDRDLDLFKERVLYNALATEQEKYEFLLTMADGNKDAVHNMHDLYAPLINRRFAFEQVKEFLEQQGMAQIERTIDHSELFIRAVKGDVAALGPWSLPKPKAPYWFQHHNAA
jgi:SAM-dependent methyltransferase